MSDFPSGIVSRFEVYAHDITGAPYVYDDTKNSWMTLASLGAQVYSGTQNPELNGVILQDGDLWWDSNLLELRVFHKPLVPGETVIGTWVSSTNPEMSPQDADRNRYIGTVVLDAPQYDVYEDLETTWKANLVGGTLKTTDDMNMVDIEWTVSPPSVPTTDVNGNFVDVNVIIYNPNSLNTNIVWPKGTYFFENGSQIGFNVFCRVTAKPEFEDEFIKPTERSDSIRVYPKLSKGTSFTSDYTLDSFDIPSTVDSNVKIIGFSGTNVSQAGDEFIFTDVVGIETSFFVEDSIDNSLVDSTQAPLIFTTVEDSQQPVDIISSGYQVRGGEYFDDDTARNGYTIDVTGLATDTKIYIYSSYDQTIKGTLIIK